MSSRLGLLHLVLLLCLDAVAAAAAVALPGCRDSCGNISIPYPFGIGDGCFKEGFNLTCTSRQPAKLLLGDGTIQVLEILLDTGNVRIKSQVTVTTSVSLSSAWTGLVVDGPFTISVSRNKFTAIGCGILAYAVDPTSPGGDFLAACASVCSGVTDAVGSCSGIGCCQTSVPSRVRSFGIQVRPLNQTSRWKSSSKVFLAEDGQFGFGLIDLTEDGDYWASRGVPAILDWTVGNLSCTESKSRSVATCSENGICLDSTQGTGHLCSCAPGYDGNPYLPHGCQDINECEHPSEYPCYGTCFNAPGTYECRCPDGTHGNASTTNGCFPIAKGGRSSTLEDLMIGIGMGLGLLLILVIVAMLSKMLKARRARKLKEKYFKQNRGLLLQQLISSSNDTAEKVKIFKIEELEKATDNFDKTRILGRGGHGTVYKGILSDQRVVAIKKSKIVAQREIDQFINEVAILSQINHRNVVKLFGCCLETQVPLLVYEFISRGTLSYHLRAPDQCSSLSWEDRLRIAVGTASAVAYLHSAATISVFHRDVKSANILLDDGFTAKVSDFGASRSVPLDQTRITTAIQGTFGYLDPEYFYTCQLTEKSDVYSFGVILVELLTGKKPISRTRLGEARNLATEFTRLMPENRLYKILDARVLQEGPKAEVEAVAAIAEMCLRMKGKERPSMKEVEVKLEALIRRGKQIQCTSIAGLPDESSNLLSQPFIGGSIDDTTRQYSLENEYVWSSNFPR